MINQYTEISEEIDDAKKEEEDKAPLSLGLKIILYVGICIVSLTMVLYGVLSFTNSINTMKYKSVEAVVRDEYASRKRLYVLDYQIDGKDYSNYCRLNKDVKIKSTITVYYNPKNKEEIIPKKSINIISIFVAIAGLFLFKFGVTKAFAFIKEAKVYFKEEEIE